MLATSLQNASKKKEEEKKTTIQDNETQQSVQLYISFVVYQVLNLNIREFEMNLTLAQTH